MATIDAPTIAQLLREFAGRASLRDGNPYRAKAYARAADSLAASRLSHGERRKHSAFPSNIVRGPIGKPMRNCCGLRVRCERTCAICIRAI